MSKGATRPRADDDQFPEDVRNQSTEALRLLRDADPNHPVDVYVDREGTTPLTLPPVVRELLTEILAKVAADQPISIVTPETVFSTQQAADLLNVSRPYIIKLIDSGELPADRVGRHRRIKASSLDRYRVRQQAVTREAARNMTRLAAEWDDD